MTFGTSSVALLRHASAVAFGALALAAPLAAQQTRAERSKYLETSTYADVVAFIDSLQARGARIHVGSIGRTSQGRDIPYVIASRPLVSTPQEARRLGRPVVYVQANIHAGEVEGKEALQALLRDLLFSPKPNVLDSIVLIAVPIYNADGNEAFKPQAQNRYEQLGPEMVGQRPNAQQLDLNRDYVKAEAPETRASLAMFNAWDPDLFVDLHTTDGSYHGYALTYSPSLHPAAAIAGGTFGGAFMRDSMLPVIRERMRTRHRFEVFPYGNFDGDEGQVAPGTMRGWSTYDHRARYGTNYTGLRGRLSLLSEAYSHDPFERRVKSTYAFLQEALTLTAQRAKAVLALTRGADAALEAGRIGSVPVRAELTAHPSMEPVIEAPLDTLPEARAELAGRATAARTRGAAGRAGGAGRSGCPWPLSEPGVRCGFKRSGRLVTTTMPVRDRFDATVSASMPVAYVFSAGPAADSLLPRLRMHGIVVEQLLAAATSTGGTFAVDSVVRSARPFQGHAEVRLEGRWSASRELPLEAGSFVVRTAQPLGVLATVLLDPQTDDGFLTWNVLDPALAALGDKMYPVRRVTSPLTVPTRILP
ncbi:MAG: M14 family metallopeptidase [Gemmatimonadetes bacterium]|nr:M14 family metallopeptidase [Gemmatimonadota bacterium]MBI3569255.1 M14 family metallopeptidase [Gemmatimonadota bacterium]